MPHENTEGLSDPLPHLDKILFGIDWEEQVTISMSESVAARQALRDIANDPTLSAAERHKHQMTALMVHSQAMQTAVACTAMLLASRDRALELFTE